MKHLRLLGMESEREALLKTMQDLECVEISHIDGSEEALKTGLAKPDDRALLNAQEESRAYRAALAALDRFLASACAAAYCSASCFSSSCTCCNSSIAMLSFTSFSTAAGKCFPLSFSIL
mgnify:CR=1 FL=1